jgi:aspartate aminotransferase
MIAISALASSVQPSATLAAGAKARALRAKGITVYDFSLGEPDFPTPEHICAAAVRAMQTGQTHYTPAGGTAELKKTVAAWYQRTYGLEVAPEQVLISNGAKHSIHNVLAATVGPGDEVVIPTPYWVSYSDLVMMTGAKPILIPTTAEALFKATPEQLQAALSDKTRLVMLNSPCNPTGTVYTQSELEAIVDVIAPTQAAILSDEIYELLTYGSATPTCVATLRPAMKDRVITVSGASKSYAMTGWRIGWTIAPAAVIKAMDNIQSQETSCPSSISQAAMVEALNSPLSATSVAQMRAEFAERRDLVCRLVDAIPGITYPKPEGAFYLFFNVSAYFGKQSGEKILKDSASFCEAALEQAHVNVVPGSAFGCEGYVRMSFATDRATIQTGIERLSQWLAQTK